MWNSVKPVPLLLQVLDLCRQPLLLFFKSLVLLGWTLLFLDLDQKRRLAHNPLLFDAVMDEAEYGLLER